MVETKHILLLFILSHTLLHGHITKQLTMSDKCMICLEEMHGSIGCIIPCGHCFHRECFEALRESTKEEASATPSSNLNFILNTGNGKLPRCPVCNSKAKKFVDIFLTFDNSREPCCGGGGSRGRLESDESLASENVRLRVSLESLKKVSKGQSEVILEILPRFEQLQKKYNKIEGLYHQLKEEYSLLQMIKNERDLLEERLNGSRKKREFLSSLCSELEQKLILAKKKRDILESKEAVQVMNDFKKILRQCEKEKEELMKVVNIMMVQNNKPADNDNTVKMLKITVVVTISTMIFIYLVSSHGHMYGNNNVEFI